MGRAPCCEKVGLKKGPWTLEEDQKLTAYINEHGHGSWRALPKKAGLLRCGKSCRLRWTNYLRPDIKRGEFSSSEEQTIIQLHALLGNRWSAIATHLPKRTDNEIKNYWNTHLKKRLIKMGLDPVTHKPQTAPNTSPSDSNVLEAPNTGSKSSSSSSIAHMAQWESVRLEAEARLAREAELRAKGAWQHPSVGRSPDQSDHLPSPILDPRACTTNSDLLSSLKQTCPLKIEAGSRDSLDHAKLSMFALLSSLRCNPNALLASLKQEAPANGPIELANSLQNWRNSLQGQAGLMWPDSWKFSNTVEGQESSSCSSPTHGTDHGSPTSTLCSFEQLSKQCLPHNSSLMPSTQARKLYWSAHNALNSSSKPLVFAQAEDEVMQGIESSSTDGNSDGSLLGLPCMQELVCEGYNNRSEDSLLIASNSSGFLSDLELAEDISSSRDQSSSAGDASGVDIRQISYSALLGEEYTDCEWNSVLKETEDVSISEGKIESPSL